MRPLFARLVRFSRRGAKRVINKFRYLGINVASNANLDILGEFIYQNGCSIGEGVNVIIPQQATLVLGEDCYIGRYVELGPRNRIEVGSQTSIQDRSILIGDVCVGRYCLISLNVLISSGQHYYDLIPWCLIKDQDQFVAQNQVLAATHSKPVVIEDDCWLGVNVVVMAGVTIGKGAVIGANSVVTKDVFPYTVVVGSPAREIKKRLEFVPPQSITYKNSKDLPYFYSGFEISKVSMEKYSEYEGLVTQNEFIVCLDAASGNSIRLIVRCLTLHKCSLTFGNQIKEISDQFKEVVFENNNHARETSRIHMRSEINSAQLIVKQVWIQ